MAVSNLHGQAVQAQQTERSGLEPSSAGAVLSAFFGRFFRQPTPKEMARRELAEAQRARLQALSAAEYAEALALYHAQRIDRLSAFLESEK
jgi:hypothetical protein